MNFGQTEYDHELLVGSTTNKLFLMDNPQTGESMYKVTEDVPQYRNPLRIVQDNWVDGHGKYRLGSNDSMYFEGQAIDTTQEGRVILGPELITVQESDDTDLDGAPVGFKWFQATSEWLCWTAGKIYRYIQDDTGIDTNEVLDASETGIDCDIDATSAIPVGSIIEIESEMMEVTATGTTLTVIRGIRSTTAATHVTNTNIFIKKWTAAATTLTGVVDMEEYNGVMYAARGAATLYSYSSDGNTWTATDLTDGYAVKFLATPNPDGTAANLWKIKTPNELSRTTDGRTLAAGGVQWESPTYVGDTSHNVVNLFMHGNRLFVGKVDNMFLIDSNGGVHPYRDDLKVYQSTANFQYVTIWQTSTYHSEGRGISEISAYDTYDLMGPLNNIDDIGKVGTIVGLASSRDFLFVAVDEGTNTHIYKGREILDSSGKLRWQWCPWIFASTTAVATIAVCQHSATDIRLWIGYGNATAYAVITDNPTTDAAARFTTTGWLRMSYEYGTNPNWDKLMQSVVTETKGCNASGEDVVIQYRKDTDTSATASTGDITTNGVVETNFSSALAAKRIQFEIHLSSNTNTATPEVTYIEVKGIEKPETVRTHEAIYQLRSDATDDVETLRSNMRTARTSTSLIKFADVRYGDSTSDTNYVWVVMEPGYPREIEIVHTKNQKPVLGLECRFREVSFTIS